MSLHALASKKYLQSDDAAQELLTLLAQLLRSQELPELVIAGAWRGIEHIITSRPRLAPVGIVELGLFELGVQQLRAIGSPADMVSISRTAVGNS